MAGASHEPLKVVYINTHYVETDQMSFKSVVQSLTGKDSTAAWRDKKSFLIASPKRKKCGGNSCVGGSGPAGGGVLLSSDFMSQDFERLLPELPSLEELRWW